MDTRKDVSLGGGESFTHSKNFQIYYIMLPASWNIFKNLINMQLGQASWQLFPSHKYPIPFWHVLLHATSFISHPPPSSLWLIIVKNTDCSTEPLARPFARSLVPLTCSLARSLRSLPRSWESKWLDGYFFCVFFYSGPQWSEGQTAWNGNWG